MMTDNPEPDANMTPEDGGKIAPRAEGAGEATPASPASIIPPEIADKLPTHVRETLEFGMMTMGAGPHPLAQHINSEHISKLIDNAEQESIRQDTQSKRKIDDGKHTRLTASVVGILLVIILGAFLCFIPKDRVEVFQEFGKDAVILIAGGIGGYGWASKKFHEGDE
ncbi:MAG TPA: hypothetical protein VHE55_11425 [Fimbriimonadaceae bacterium]|nr:hypothetical protein [Fimbriimonadaceae bacterium]